MSNDELIKLFPTPISILKYNKDITKELEYIENGIKYFKMESDGNLRSTDSYLLEHNQLLDIRKFIEEGLDKFTTQVLSSKQKLKVTQAWSSKNPKWSMVHEHIHSNSIVSGVFYFRVNGDQPPITFHKPQYELVSMDYTDNNNFNSNAFKLRINAGELILFPSQARHSVSINKSDDIRISLSFNSFSVDKLGTERLSNELDLKKLMDKN